MATKNKQLTRYAISVLKNSSKPRDREIAQDVLYTLVDGFTITNLLEDVQEAPYDYNYTHLDLLEWIQAASN